jgi:hypothetical protein
MITAWKSTRTCKCKLRQDEKVYILRIRLAENGVSSVEVLVDISELRRELQACYPHLRGGLPNCDASKDYAPRNMFCVYRNEVGMSTKRNTKFLLWTERNLWCRLEISRCLGNACNGVVDVGWVPVMDNKAGTSQGCKLWGWRVPGKSPELL